MKLPLDISDALISSSGINGSPRALPSEPPTTMSNALHVMRLRKIWARIHTLNHGKSNLGDLHENTRSCHTTQLRADLEEWRRTAPEPIPRPGRTLSIFSTKVWFDLNYSGTILNLYRTQLVDAERASDDVFLDCLQAASTVIRLYRLQYVGTAIKHTWGTLHCAFLAGLTYLHCLWSSKTACESVQYSDVSKTCIDCTMVLVVIAQEWEDGAPYRDIFETLAGRTLSMVVDRNSQGQPLPNLSPPVSGTPDREVVSRWMADIDGKGMLSGFDSLLSGFLDNMSPYDIGQNDGM